ncbi:MAG: DNA-formamidopyrimidine glycosylase family protein [Acidimicrobiales bacterium]
MPELPEVRAHAERLSELVAGSLLERLELLSFSVMKTADPPVDGAKTQMLESVTSRGKYLVLRFETMSHAVHLMQGGRLSADAKRSRKPRGGLARWTFANDEALLLTEAGKEHRAGIWTFRNDDSTPEIFSTLGPDADGLDAAMLAKILAEHSGRLHTFLRKQRPIAGIVRRLANEICFAAQISPFASTGRLDDDAVDHLTAAIATCVADSLEFERGLDKMSSSKDRPSAVHRRTGETCNICSDQIREVAYQRYTVNYCPTCQTNGKILADNTTSKFLK